MRTTHRPLRYPLALLIVMLGLAIATPAGITAQDDDEDAPAVTVMPDEETDKEDIDRTDTPRDGAGEPGSGDTAHQCRQGGWDDVVRDDLSEFEDEADCVSYAEGIDEDEQLKPQGEHCDGVQDGETEDIEDADLRHCHLVGAALAGVDLSGVDLSGADLSGVDLSGANISRALLVGTNLSNANLSGVDLLGTALNDANLTGANLTNANLSYATLGGADLSGADVTGVTWRRTRCVDNTNSDDHDSTCEGHL